VDLIRLTTLTVRQQFLDAGVPSHKLIHRYPGVDLRRYQPGDKTGNLRVAFVGPLSLRKGIHIAAEIGRRLPPNSRLEVVGGPVDSWSRRVSQTPDLHVTRSVPDLLSRAHIFILPSASDAFAYTVIEALASGAVPIVSARVGAGEIVRRVDERLVLDLDGFADRFLALLPELDLESLARRGREVAAEFERTARADTTAQAVVDAAGRLLATRSQRHIGRPRID
jgi:glycosyltransferase involved in cell wall biosynthesis